MRRHAQGQVAGGLNMSKELRFADNQRLIPWAPIRADSSQKDILINLGIAVRSPTAACFGLCRPLACSRGARAGARISGW